MSAKRKQGAGQCGGCFVAALALVCASLPLAVGAERVVFVDQRVLEVDSVEEQGEFLLLRFGSGGTMMISKERVIEIRPMVSADPDPEPTRVRTERWRKNAGRFETHIERAAEMASLEPSLVLAVAIVESSLDPAALSPKGAMGLMQLMPATADLLSVDDPYDPAQNLEAGAQWLRRMLDSFEEDLDLALAAYNAGENAVRRFGGIPPFVETTLYVEKVRDRLEKYRDVSFDSPGG